MFIDLNKKGKTIIMITHDAHLAKKAKRVIRLKDGKIVKERSGLHSMKKKHICPHCGSSIGREDDTCPSCGKPIHSTNELFSD